VLPSTCVLSSEGKGSVDIHSYVEDMHIFMWFCFGALVCRQSCFCLMQTEDRDEVVLAEMITNMTRVARRRLGSGVGWDDSTYVRCCAARTISCHPCPGQRIWLIDG
jgi:hypothetical protein